MPPSWADSWVAITLRGPMMSFGAPQLDRLGPTDSMPGLSMVTGLLANALGYQHREGDKINALSRALEMVTLTPAEQAETREVDYQTVDLTRMPVSWSTTHGMVTRDEEGTILRFREYLCDAKRIVLFRLVGEGVPGVPGVQEILAALANPIGIPFLGRIGYPPSTPLVGWVVPGTTREEALTKLVQSTGPVLVRFEVSSEEASVSDRVSQVGDLKVWGTHSAYHVGSRWVREDVRP